MSNLTSEQEELIQGACKSLWQITDYPREHFEHLLANQLYTLAIFVNELNTPLLQTLEDKLTFLQRAIKRSIIALKRRRGYMLPIGAGAEVVDEQKAIWTYAVFTGALLQDVVRQQLKTANGIVELLPNKGIEWLQQYPTVYQTWCALFESDLLETAQQQSGMLGKLIYEAELTLSS